VRPVGPREIGMNEAIGQLLFSAEEGSVFAILDGAAVGDLLTPLYEHHPNFECLYRGELQPDIAEVVPYLVQLEPETEFTKWLLDQGWGNHWGIFVFADADLPTMRRHFRRFLTVHDPDGKPLYFRYYDPRVLRVYLPTCNASELRTGFGPVAWFLLEDEDLRAALRFRFYGTQLKQEKLPVLRS